MKRIFALIIVLIWAACPVFSQKKDAYRIRTVVIDPGHGGAKPGAQGKQSQEKQITLSVAKKFGQLLEDNYPDIKVIYTRTTDVDISLAERAHIANKNKADLFISIHANSHPTTAPTGVETFVMGLSESKANLEVARKENADILLEAGYKENADYSGFDPDAPESYVMLAMFQNAYLDRSLNLASAIQNQYKQRLKTVNRGVKQAELYVLYKTTCPSVLTEIGFISNPDEESFMLSDEGQATIALSLFYAFMNYKALEEGTAKPANPVIRIAGYQQPKPKEEKKTEEIAAEAAAPAPTAAPKDDTVKAEARVPSVEPQDTASVVAVAVPEAPAPVQTPREKPVPSAALPQKVEESTPAPQSKPAASTTAEARVSYRVQFCSSTRLMKVGDPDLQGIKDFHAARNGKHYMYTAGDYARLADARERCKQIQQSTRFKDAFVVAIYRGQRISLERAAQIEKQGK